MANCSVKETSSRRFIISHDLTLLNEVDHIYHLNEHGLQHTTGNYEKFYEQYQSQIEALEQSVHQHQREVKHMKQKQHEVLMKAQNVNVLATNFVTQTRKLKFCSILKRTGWAKPRSNSFPTSASNRSKPARLEE